MGSDVSAAGCGGCGGHFLAAWQPCCFCADLDLDRTDESGGVEGAAGFFLTRHWRGALHQVAHSASPIVDERGEVVGKAFATVVRVVLHALGAAWMAPLVAQRLHLLTDVHRLLHGARPEMEGVNVLLHRRLSRICDGAA
eukprot:1299972-Rhodomonas_salina.3